MEQLDSLLHPGFEPRMTLTVRDLFRAFHGGSTGSARSATHPCWRPMRLHLRPWRD